MQPRGTGLGARCSALTARSDQLGLNMLLLGRYRQLCFECVTDLQDLQIQSSGTRLFVLIPVTMQSIRISKSDICVCPAKRCRRFVGRPNRLNALHSARGAIALAGIDLRYVWLCDCFAKSYFFKLPLIHSRPVLNLSISDCLWKCRTNVGLLSGSILGLLILALPGYVGKYIPKFWEWQELNLWFLLIRGCVWYRLTLRLPRKKLSPSSNGQVLYVGTYNYIRTMTADRIIGQARYGQSSIRDEIPNRAQMGFSNG